MTIFLVITTKAVFSRYEKFFILSIFRQKETLSLANVFEVDRTSSDILEFGNLCRLSLLSFYLSNTTSGVWALFGRNLCFVKRIFLGPDLNNFFPSFTLFSSFCKITALIWKISQTFGVAKLTSRVKCVIPLPTTYLVCVKLLFIWLTLQRWRMGKNVWILWED